MSAPPRVSVVVPAYNHAPFVHETLSSLLAQSFADLEVVVVDDGSTDSTLEVLAGFRADPRMRLFTQGNQGAHAAIARGLALARGEHVFVCNSDDAFAPTRLEHLVSVLEGDPEAAAACSWIEVVDETGKRLGVKEAWRTLPPWPRPEPGPSLDDLGSPCLALLATNFVSTTSNLAFRRSALARVELAPLRFCHDWDLALQLGRLGALRVVEEPLVRYRVHPSNTLKEGRGGSDGAGRMHFEILWTVARHAPAILAATVAEGRDGDDLRRRFWRSVPRFGRLDIVSRLLALSAHGGDAWMLPLLETSHPLRRAMVAALAGAPNEDSGAD